MKYVLALLLMTTIFTFNAKAQTTEDSVKATVTRLFDAMRNADAAGLVSTFADSAVLQTIARTKEGNTTIRNESVKEFAESVAKLTKGIADERVEFETIKIDGPLASVWTPYKFYYKGQFSHCGVDSYQLVRLNGQWKIQYLIDTRRKECGN